MQETLPYPSEQILISTEDIFASHPDLQVLDEKFSGAILELTETAVDALSFGAKDLPYHDRIHTINVINAFTLIGLDALNDRKISAREFCLGVIACASHDLDYKKSDKDSQGVNEQRSIASILDLLSGYDESIFSENDRQVIGDTIDATIFKGVGDDGSIEQKESSSYLALLVQDADLCNLAMPWEWAKKRFDAYYMELNDKDSVDQNDPAYEKFIEFEIRTLNAQKYKTQHARLRWATGSDSPIQTNVTHLENLLKEIRGIVNKT